MGISYNIYANDGQGGDVNYETPIASTALQSYVINPFGFPGDHTFAVRAFDTTSGIEEANTDARVRIVLDSLGNDVTAQPRAVFGLSATPTAGGTCWVVWGYDPRGQGGPPAQFNVSMAVGTTASFSTTAATVTYLTGVTGYGCTLSGLSSNTSYVIAVQAVGIAGRLPGPVKTVGIKYQVSPLQYVDSLVAVPSA